MLPVQLPTLISASFYSPLNIYLPQQSQQQNSQKDAFTPISTRKLFRCWFTLFKLQHHSLILMILLNISSKQHELIFSYGQETIIQLSFLKLKLSMNFIIFMTQIYLVVLLSLLAILSTPAWITYATFTGYIPPYTYPLTLRAGDKLRGLLSWPGSQDLDIYLYKNGTDILSRNTWIDRQYSPTLNPQDLNYTIPTAGIYYLRVDLFSSVPTAYKLQIFINGQPISTMYGTVLTVGKAKAVEQFSNYGPCDVRIIYNGPIYNISLFAPGVDVNSGTPTIRNTTNTNPKIISASLNVVGKWNIVIDHKILSIKTLTPFSIIVQTNTQSRQCINYCSNVPYSAGMVPTSVTTICNCAPNFEWIQSNQSCSIVCSKYNSTWTVGQRIAGTADQCNCLTPGYKWNSLRMGCEIDCDLIPNSVGASGENTNNTCQCNPNFIWADDICIENCNNTNLTNLDCFCIKSYLAFMWNNNNTQCIRNCSFFENTIGSEVNSTLDCQCANNFYWDITSERCIVNCSEIEQALLFQPPNSCTCNENYKWNQKDFKCTLNCSAIKYAFSEDTNNIYMCTCLQSFFWESNSSSCFVNCGLVPHATIAESNSSCFCLPGFFWSVNQLRCVLNCSQVAYAVNYHFSNLSQCICRNNFYWDHSSASCVVNCTQILFSTGIGNSTDNCGCKNHFIWNVQIFACQIDCSYFNSTLTSNYSIDECQCNDPLFTWQTSIHQCVINCRMIQYTLPLNLTLGYNYQCQCQNKFFWNSSLRICEINCSQIKNSRNPLQQNSTHSFCECDPHFIWHVDYYQCLLDCSSINYTNITGEISSSTNNTECTCFGKFVYHFEQYPGQPECVINCSKIVNTINETLNDIHRCVCRQNFIWRQDLLQCKIDCQQYQYTIGNKNRSLTKCICQQFFFWNQLNQRCQLNCSSLNYTTNILQQNHLRCNCIQGYFWHNQRFICSQVPDDPIIVQVLESNWANFNICSHQLQVSVNLQPTGIQTFSLFTLLYISDRNSTYLPNHDFQVSSYRYNNHFEVLNMTLKVLSDIKQPKIGIILNSTSKNYSPYLCIFNVPNSTSAAFYTKDQCSEAQSILDLAKFFLAASYLSGVLGIANLCPKIIGLQLFGVLQLAYFSIAEHYKDINLYIYQLNVLKFSNGPYFQSERELQKEAYLQMPLVLSKDMGIPGLYFSCYNFMAIFILAYCAILTMMYQGQKFYLKWILKRQVSQIVHQSNISIQNGQQIRIVSSERVQKLQKYLRLTLNFVKQGFITLLIFSSFNLCFALTSLHKYFEGSPNVTLSIMSLYLICILVCILFLDFGWTGIDIDFYGEFKEQFKYNWVCRMYILVSILYRGAIGFSISCNLQSIYITLLPIFFSIFFLLYTLTNLPFTSTLHNYRANLIHITNLITLITANYYRSMKSNTPLPQKSHQFSVAILLYIFISLSVIFSLITIIYEVTKKVRSLIRRSQESELVHQYTIEPHNLNKQRKKPVQSIEQEIDQE